MTEPTRADAPRSRSLAVLAVPLLIVVVLLAVAYGMGYLEIGLILVVLLPFALPASPSTCGPSGAATSSHVQPQKSRKPTRRRPSSVIVDMSTICRACSSTGTSVSSSR